MRKLGVVSHIVIPQQWVDQWGLQDSQPSLLVKLGISETALEAVLWPLHAYACTFICTYTTPGRTFDSVFAVNRIVIPVSINGFEKAGHIFAHEPENISSHTGMISSYLPTLWGTLLS